MSAKQKIKARAIVNDIRAHMTDAELMEKYHLSVKGLQSVFVKLLNIKAISMADFDWRPSAYDDTSIIRQIKTTEIVEAIRSGMTDYELMEKYSLSPEGLERAFQTLVDGDAINVADLDRRSVSQDDTVFIECLRELPRHYLAVAVNVFELAHPDKKGSLRDVTEKGIGISGIEARAGETKKLVIPSEKFLDADPIEFQAKCMWAKREDDEGEWAAGFQITNISEKCLDNLRRLIRALSLHS